MIIPGVQAALQPVLPERLLDRVNCPSVASPSIVVTSPPSAWTASTLQDLTLLPFRWTVHAPVAGVAPDDGAGLSETFTEVLHERHPWFDVVGDRCSVDVEADTGHGRLLRCEAVTRLTLGGVVGERLARLDRWLSSAAGDREPPLEQGYGGVRPAREGGQADLDDLGVVRRPLAVADHGVGLRVGQQRLPDGDRDVLRQLAQGGRVGARQQVAAVRLDRFLDPAAAEQSTWSTSVVAGIISR